MALGTPKMAKSNSITIDTTTQNVQVFTTEATPSNIDTTSQYLTNIPENLRAEVLKQKDSIVFGDTNSIQKFGYEVSEASARFTNDSTSSIKIGNAGEIGDKLNNMMKVSKSLDTSILLSDKKPGFLGSLFGKAKDNIETFKNNQKSINDSLKEIGNNLLADREKLMNENKKLEGMFSINSANIKMFDVIVAAGMIKCKEIENNILPSLAQKAQQSNLPEDANAYRAGQNFLRQLDVRVANMNSARSLAILQEPMLQDMQSNNSSQMENISTMVQVGIPAWHQQICMVISQLETKKSVEVTNSIANNINETMKQNATLMGQNSAMIAEAVNTPIIAVDTIAFMQAELFTSIDKVKQINEAGKIKRAENVLKLSEMEKELKAKLLN